MDGWMDGWMDGVRRRKMIGKDLKEEDAEDGFVVEQNFF